MLPSRTRPEIVNIHASCVAAGNGGVLILGNSGQGKSDLALRLIDRGARLVADDRCDIWFDRGRLWCRPPENLAGKLEVRGIGIVDLPYIEEAALSIIVDLVSSDQVDRLPAQHMEELLGCRISSITLAPFEASAPAKIKMAIRLPAEGYPL